ncbi:MAG: M3 family oligoendopeptidase [Alphaproteobacteria bacterium]
MSLAADALADLPTWSLDDLYTGLHDPRLEAEAKGLAKDAASFEADLAGRVVTLEPAALAEAVQRYEALEERAGRLSSYAGLVFATDSTDAPTAKFYADMQAGLTTLASKLLFFEHELNDIDDDTLDAAFAQSPALERYRPWLRRLRTFRPFRLDQDLERLSLERSQTGNAAWVRLFDQTTAAMRVCVDGQDMTQVEAMDQLSHPDRGAREAAAKGLAQQAERQAPLFALIFNTLVKDKAIDDRWRGLQAPTHARHLANDVDPEVVEALATAVKDAYPRLSHRYYAWKGRALGLEPLAYWDRLAPPPGEDNRIIPWGEARDVILDAFGGFSPQMADLGRRFFDQAWIDAPSRPGKAGGAFAHPTVPSAHPYILLNYRGKARDVMTLAHELGHGVHQILAGGQGLLLSQTPLTLAETASVFGEMLTFQALLERETDPMRRRHLLAAKIEDKISTAVRQIAFYEFEKAVHDSARGGELTPEDFNRLWRETQDAALGPAIDLEGYDGFWALVPHFIHVPFYVYAYAFGEGLVNVLYDLYAESDPGFVDRYLRLLADGGARRYDAALEPFGLDARDPAFWARGLDVIERMLNELEEQDG